MSNLDSTRDLLTASPRELPAIVEHCGIESYLEDPAATAILTYYQKYFGHDVRKALNEHFKNNAFRLPLDRYTEQQRKHILKNLGALQLTYGCNGACDFCGFDAVAGAKEHIPFPQLRLLLQELAVELPPGDMSNPATPFPFWASDPLDYRSEEDGEERTYYHVAKLWNATLGYPSPTSTVVPKGSDAVFKSLIEEGQKIGRLSIGSDAHRASLKQRGLIDLGPTFVEHEYSVDIAPLGRYGENKETADDWRLGMGIGCFNGMLITPRGVYSVVQNPGSHPATPQKQFVIPYTGNAPRCPEVGDDIRLVLSQHIPLIDRSYVCESLYEGHHNVRAHERGEYCFVIAHPSEQGFLLISFMGTHISNVEDAKTYENLAPMYYTDKLEIEGRSNLVGPWYALCMAKYATMAVDHFETEVPVDRALLRKYMKKEIQNDRCSTVASLFYAYDLWNDGFWQQYCNAHPDADSMDAVRFLLRKYPHWTVAYATIFREEFPHEKIIAFNPYHRKKTESPPPQDSTR